MVLNKIESTSASENRIFSSLESSLQLCNSDCLASSLILSSSISLCLFVSLFCFLFFFFFFSRSNMVPPSIFLITSSLPTLGLESLQIVKSISYNYGDKSILSLASIQLNREIMDLERKFFFLPSKDQSSYETIFKMFPQLGSQHTFTSILKFNYSSERTVINEQINFNQFIDFTKRNPKAFLPYFLIDIISQKKRAAEIHEVIALGDHYLCGNFEALLIAMIKQAVAQKVASEELEMGIKFMWEMFLNCLRQVESSLKQSEYCSKFLKYPFQFVLISGRKNPNQFKVLAKLGENNRDSLFFVNEVTTLHVKKVSSKVLSNLQQPQLSAYHQMVKRLISPEHSTNSKNLRTKSTSKSNAFPEYFKQFLKEQSLREDESWRKFCGVQLSQFQMIDLLKYNYSSHLKHIIQYLDFSLTQLGASRQGNQILEWSIVDAKKRNAKELDGIILPSQILHLWPLAEQIMLYSAKYQLFKYTKTNIFYNYSHLELYITRLKNHKFRRQDINYILSKEKVSLHAGPKSEAYLISTPVRGKYCRHLEFYDLREVYAVLCKKNLSRPESQIKLEEQGQEPEQNLETKSIPGQDNGMVELEEGFECFSCGQWVEFDDLIFLQEVKVLMKHIVTTYLKPHYDLLKEQYADDLQQVQSSLPSSIIGEVNNYRQWTVYLQIDHEKQTVDLVTKFKDCLPVKTFLTNCYGTLVDPLLRFRPKFNHLRVTPKYLTGNSSYGIENTCDIESSWSFNKEDDFNDIQNMTVMNE